MFYEQVKKMNFSDIVAQILDARPSVEQVFSVLNRAETLEKLEAEDLLLLLNPDVWATHKEAIRAVSHKLTVQRHGKTIRFYAPLYLSNECTNSCIYCGFSKNNGVSRLTLSEEEILQEAKVIRSLGIEHLLLVSGECPKTVGDEYLIKATKLLRGIFSSLSIEVAPMDEGSYKKLFDNGIDGVICYQETYNPSVYAECHKTGPKSDMQYRINTLDRAGVAGMRFLGLGALLGLSDHRAEAFFLGMHARYLEKKYWRSLVSISFPRIRPSKTGFRPKTTVNDDELLHMMSVLRLFLPDSNLLLSTRENVDLRDKAMFYGINQMSAGSKTDPLGYSGHSSNCEQFSISDTRTPQEISERLSKLGYDPVFKDWDKGFRNEN